MIAYTLVGSTPTGVTPALLRRLGGAFRGVRGIPKQATASIRFVSRAQMHALNKAFRHKNRPTDVLSFSAREGKALPRVRMPGPVELGDIVVCAAVAREEARRRGMDVMEELVRLMVHGTLHLAGMDHVTEREEEHMFGLQEQVIARVIA